MATTVNEQIVTGRKFRKLIDEASRLWLRISFWTKASDVEFNDGETAETKFVNIANTINSLKQSFQDLKQSFQDLKQSFQDGVNKIFNFLNGLGFTPSPNSPDGICNAIQNMYNKRYSDGRTQGRQDVINDPNEYGISTNAKHFNMVSGTTDTYVCPADGNYTVIVKYVDDNDQSHNNYGNKVVLNIAGSVYTYLHFHHSGSSWKDEPANASSGVPITKYCTAGSVISLEVSGNYISEDDCIYTFAGWCVI